MSALAGLIGGLPENLRNYLLELQIFVNDKTLAKDDIKMRARNCQIKLDAAITKHIDTKDTTQEAFMRNILARRHDAITKERQDLVDEWDLDT